ncbi:MAG: riboflavin synthase [Verrucomicrobia bacterium]|jgi:riboflavin synthase|nr:MAG: riboflavin synthase [Verrucomicrobiota bacterium]
MFTGIVERTVEVREFRSIATGARLVLDLGETASELSLGESVAVNGCCLTVAGFLDRGGICFDLLAETLRLTNLGDLGPGKMANIERALRVGDRLSGHFVQGHIDCCSRVLVWEAVGQDHRLTIELPPEFARCTIWKGSITVDGMSLTIAELEPDRFTLWITPHTWAVTNLRHRQVGDRVNLEFDVLAKYVQRALSGDLHGSPTDNHLCPP